MIVYCSGVFARIDVPFTFLNLIRRSNMKLLASLPCVALIGVSFVSPSADAEVLVGPGVNNGDFETDTATSTNRFYAVTPSWTDLNNDDSNTVATKNDTLNYSPGRNLIVLQSANTKATNDTGYSIVLGDSFDVSYVWRDALNWAADDKIGIQLFTTSDNTLAGVANPLTTSYSPASTQAATWESVDQDGIYVASAADVGKNLFVSIVTNQDSAANTGFARVDNFVLEVTPIPEPGSMALLALGGAMLLRRRRA